MFKSIIRRVGTWWNQTFNARLFIVEARAKRQHEYIKALEQKLERVEIETRWYESTGTRLGADEYPWAVTSWTVQLPESDEWPEVIGE
jgi:hypothetical protein